MSTINTMLNANLNSALLTKYTTGKEHLGFHADDESCIKQQSPIVTASLGATRIMDFIQNADSSIFSAQLCHASLLIMYGNFQKYYKHSIRPDQSSGTRISITFRELLG